MEGDNFAESISLIKVISIHSLRMEGDPDIHTALFQFFYFNPLPPHGGRLGEDKDYVFISSFQSTPSAWRETTLLGLQWDDFDKFQSTPSAWRETTMRIPCLILIINFNPLPPHGGRHCVIAIPIRPWYFNPLPPHGGRPFSFVQL